MSSKRVVLSDPESCLSKAHPDEPIFVIRAKDPLAPLIVRMWAELANHLNAHETEKISQARHEANAMARWRSVEYGDFKIDLGD